jgi:hypothetical protein
VCTGLQIPHIQAGFISLPCPVLHRIAFPVVSQWCQEAMDYASPVPSQTEPRPLFYNPIHRSSWRNRLINGWAGLDGMFLLAAMRR